MEQNQINRIHRVGSITTGVTLVVGGVMFILCGVFNILSYEMVFKFWPLILIGLGIELLWCNIKDSNTVYDKGAIALLFMMSFFSMGMAMANMIINECAQQIHSL